MCIILCAVVLNNSEESPRDPIQYAQLIEKDTGIGAYTDGKGFMTSGALRKQAVINLAKLNTESNDKNEENKLVIKTNRYNIKIHRSEEENLLTNFNKYLDAIKIFQKIAKKYPCLEVIPFDAKLQDLSRNDSNKEYRVVYSEPDRPELYNSFGVDICSANYESKFNKPKTDESGKAVQYIKNNYDTVSTSLNQANNQFDQFVTELKDNGIKYFDFFGTDNVRIIPGNQTKIVLNSSCVKFKKGKESIRNARGTKKK